MLLLFFLKISINVNVVVIFVSQNWQNLIFLKSKLTLRAPRIVKGKEVNNEKSTDFTMKLLNRNLVKRRRRRRN